MVFSEPLLRDGKPPLVIGHRGASAHAPENTMPSFHAAFDAGATWVETDVQPTSDNALVLIHDDCVDRTTDGTGDIRALAADVALGLDAGSWFGDEFSGTRIPLLTDLLSHVTGQRRVLLEIKGDHTTEQLAAMLDLVSQAGCDERVFMESFEVPVLRRLRTLRPGDPIGLLVETIGGSPVSACDELGATSFNPDYTELLRQPGLVTELHAAGIATMPWTCDDPGDWERLTALGVDGIITNRPAELLAWQVAHEG